MDSLTPTPHALEGVIIPPEGGPSELVLVKRDPQTFFLDEGFLKALLAEIGTRATSFTPDTTTDKGRKLIVSIAYRVSQTKTYLDDMGKTAVAELKERPKLIDAGRKLLRDGLDGLRDEVRQPLTEWEDAEKAKATHIQNLKNWAALAPGTTAGAIESAITSLEAEPTMDIPGAEEAKQTAMASLREQLAARKQHESDQAELARLREEQRLRDEEAERERLRLEGEARARKRLEEEAEAARIQAEAAAELEAAKQNPEVAEPSPAAQALHEEEGAGNMAGTHPSLAIPEEPAAPQSMATTPSTIDPIVERKRRCNNEAMADLHTALAAAPMPLSTEDPRAVAAEAIVRAIARGQVRNVVMAYGVVK